MKSKILFVLVLLFVQSFMYAQKASKKCPPLKLDLVTGKLNGLLPSATQAQVKKKLPCFTGDSEDGGDFNCGGGVFYLKDDFFFYTGKNFIEIRSKFKGTISTPLLGMSETNATTALKMEVERTVKDESGTSKYNFYATKYGCIVVCIEQEKVSKIAVYDTVADDVELCL